jgi:hypothetical protein
MGAPEDSHEKENQREPFKWAGLESVMSELESLCPEAQHRQMEGQQIGCESRVKDEILSAACDCHGDSCCC